MTGKNLDKKGPDHVTKHKSGTEGRGKEGRNLPATPASEGIIKVQGKKPEKRG